MKLFLGGTVLLTLLASANQNVAALASLHQNAAAQDTSKKVVVANRLMATVGKTAITQAMVDERLYLTTNPSLLSPDALKTTRRNMLDTLINAEMLYQEALRDTSIHITEQEVSEEVDRQIKAQRAQRTPAQFETALQASGYKSADEFRLKSLDDSRRSKYIERFTDMLREKGLIKPLNPMEREVRAVYDERAKAGQLPNNPPAVTFKQIVLAAKATPEAQAKAKRLADSLVKVLRDGADFSEIATRFSQDEETRVRGGDFKWVRRGAEPIDRTFEDAAFALKPGQISDPVLTQFGYHIIQLARKLVNEAHIFHILIVPDVDSAGVKFNEQKAENIRQALLKGASFDSIQRIEHDQHEARGTEGGPAILDSLPPIYAPLKTMAVGGYSPVLTLPSPSGSFAPKFAILMLTQKYPEGPLPYEVVREEIKSELAIQYGQEAYLKELRRRIYVNILDK